MQRRACLLILLENFSDYAVYFRRSLFVDITFVDLICVRGCTPSAVSSSMRLQSIEYEFLVFDLCVSSEDGGLQFMTKSTVDKTMSNCRGE